MAIRYLALLVIAISLLTSEGMAQVVETSKGKIEFVGLEKWTPQMIQQKLGFDSPDKLHYCAALLKSTLGFPDASVMTYMDEGNRYKVIAVVEPQHSERIHFKPRPSGSVQVTDEWQELVNVAEENFGQDFAFGLLSYGRMLLNRQAANETAQPWWEPLKGRRAEKDFNLALRVLKEDSSRAKRMVAAGVLMNFGDKDAAWQALMEGLRDLEDMVKASCMHALKSLTDHAPRPVDWKPVQTSIRHILNGTSLFGLPFAIESLLKTGISEETALPLLRDGGGRMLLAYLKANHKRERELAHELLARLRGADLGYEVNRWAAWIDELKSQK